jgi:hypothetical protein
VTDYTTSSRNFEDFYKQQTTLPWEDFPSFYIAPSPVLMGMFTKDNVVKSAGNLSFLQFLRFKKKIVVAITAKWIEVTTKRANKSKQMRIKH